MKMALRKTPVVDGPPPITDPAELAAELERERALDDARRVHELAQTRAGAGFDRARADVAEDLDLAELARVERRAEVRANAELSALYREFRGAGERTRIKSLMHRSGEARALRLEHLRVLNVKVLVPLLVGFGLWSTTGVQAGASRLMNVDSGSPVWWALWGLEALLIGTVCWIIVVRARLAASGGRLSTSAERIGAACLTISVFLNLIAAVPAPGSHVDSWWAVPGSMFAHLLGPVGAAVVAHLIGSIDKSISDADPWHDEHGQAVPLLADMDLRAPALTSTDTASAAPVETTTETVSQVSSPGTEESRDTAVPEFSEPSEGASEAPRSTADQAGKQGSEAPGDDDDETVIWDWIPPRPFRTERPNKGVAVPEIVKNPPAPSVRTSTDDALAWRLYDMVAAGEVDAPDGVPSIRTTQTALGVRFDRAKTVLDLYRDLRRTLPEHARLNAGPANGQINGVVRP
ncbi:hypothetical protein [Actinomadura sp. 6N118]|uniref:hypothetical protein n=1 Tax=Actinomadura sp. 6N118 TaxID=3375151 RepID=UPI0037997EFC